VLFRILAQLLETKAFAKSDCARVEKSEHKGRLANIETESSAGVST